MGKDPLNCRHTWVDDWEDNVLFGDINYPKCSKCGELKPSSPSIIALGVYR